MKQDYLWSYHFVVDGDNLWFVPYWYNILCMYNMKSKKLELIKKLPQDNEIEGIYLNLVKAGQYLVLVPMYAQEVCIYEMHAGEFKCLKVHGKAGLGSGLFSTGIWKNNVYMFAAAYPEILKLDMQSGCIGEIPVRSIPDGLVHGDEGCNNLFMQSSVSENRIDLLMFNSSYVLSFNMDTETGEFLKIGNGGDRYLSVCRVSSGELFLVCQNGSLIVYDERRQAITAVKNLMIEGCGGNVFEQCQNFIECAEYGNFVYFFVSSMIIEVDQHHYRARKAWFSDILTEDNDGRRTKDYTENFFAVKKEGDVLYVHNRMQGIFYCIDMMAKKVEKFCIPLDTLSGDDMKIMFGQYKNIAIEGKALYLSLDNLLAQLDDERSPFGTEKNVGRQIWETMKRIRM